MHGPVSRRCHGSATIAAAPALDVSPVSGASLSLSPPDPSSDPPQSQDSAAQFQPPRISWRILKRLPKGSRECAAWKMASILKTLNDNFEDPAAWSRFIYFPSRCFRQPKRGGRRRSLATEVNKCINAELACPPASALHIQGHNLHNPSSRQSSASLAARVTSKLEEGDFRGAVRIASSDHTLAEHNDNTLAALKAKHPPAAAEVSDFPAIPQEVLDSFIEISSEEVARAIKSFPNDSAAGPDGLRPQHLKDMIGPSSGEGGLALLRALAKFVSLATLGKVPTFMCPFFFGASLIALTKKGSGNIRPIAVGCSLRRLVAKCAVNRVKQSVSSLLTPHQLGFGISKGAEAAAHAARIYLQHLPPESLLLKLDIKNAFNSLRRDKMFLAVKEHAPELLPLVLSAYSSPSSLFCGDSVINSCEGVQQGDPLGPLLFCLTIHAVVPELKSELQVLYIDDITLGGFISDIVHDFRKVSDFAKELGLEINHSKSEIICKDHTTLGSVLVQIPGLSVTDPDHATLLGSPIGNVDGVNAVVEKKIVYLKSLGGLLVNLQAHDAFCLLRNALSIPKLMYVLRSSPCFLSTQLAAFDDLQKSLLSQITNTNLDEAAWAQASLPVRLGGLGIRRAEQLAPSTFLASATACSDLINQILPVGFEDELTPFLDSALQVWSKDFDVSPPAAPESDRQRSWDDPVAQATYNSLLEKASSPQDKARLQAASQKESGAWLHALPVSSLGLRLDNSTIRVAIGLRLGIPIVQPHLCHHCDTQVDCFGTHGLSCRLSQGRFSRHASINSIVKKSLDSAKIPSRLEPNGILRSDGRRPDGVTLIPWKCGRMLVWDVTCPDTFAPSHVSLAADVTGAVADEAEHLKRMKYNDLDSVYCFAPLAIETSGVLGSSAREFFNDLGGRIVTASGEPRSSFFLLQRISVEIQRGNCISILGTLSV